MKTSAIVTVIFLWLVSIAHLLRLIVQAQITIGGTELPMLASLVACIVTAALAIWLWRDSRKTAAAQPNNCR